jgi:hypothetical protein
MKWLTSPTMAMIILTLPFAIHGINVREYDNLECAGGQGETPGYTIVAKAASNSCERTGTLTSMKMWCSAGSVVLKVWKDTDCGFSDRKSKGKVDSIKLLADTCTTFPLQKSTPKAIYYDCSNGLSLVQNHLSMTIYQIIIFIVTTILYF